MRVFISWSGTRSKFLAEALRWWLPKVVQAIRPWMSDHDIHAGARWLNEVSGELSSASVGIICITPENRERPWLIFEAGALSKSIDNTHVCPILFGLNLDELNGPLAQFQGNPFNYSGLLKVMQALNMALPSGNLADSELTEHFDVWWPKLNARMAGMPSEPPARQTTPEQQVVADLALLVPMLHAMLHRHDASSELKKSQGVSNKASSIVQDLPIAYEARELIFNLYHPFIASDGQIVTLEAIVGVRKNNEEAVSFNRWRSKQSVEAAHVLKLIEQVSVDFEGWISKGFVPPNVTISIVDHPQFDPVIYDALYDFSRAHPGSLSVGISETSLVQNDVRVIENLKRLQKAGARIIVNDFGTGYSSLNFIRKMPIDCLQIADVFVREVVTDENDAAICAAIVALATQLSLTVIASGVDNNQQEGALRKLGIDAFQGKISGSPLLTDEVVSSLLNKAPDS